MSATKVGRTRGTRTEDGIGPEPPYKVVLHDSWHPMSWVVYVLVKAISRHAGREGRRDHVGGPHEGARGGEEVPQELAELYEERLKGKGLTASVEADY